MGKKPGAFPSLMRKNRYHRNDCFSCVVCYAPMLWCKYFSTQLLLEGEKMKLDPRSKLNNQHQIENLEIKLKNLQSF